MGGSVGISFVETMLDRRSQVHQIDLVAEISRRQTRRCKECIQGATHALQARGSSAALAKQQAYGLVSAMVSRQSSCSLMWIRFAFWRADFVPRSDCVRGQEAEGRRGHSGSLISQLAPCARRACRTGVIIRPRVWLAPAAPCAHHTSDDVHANHHRRARIRQRRSADRRKTGAASWLETVGHRADPGNCAAREGASGSGGAARRTRRSSALPTLQSFCARQP